MPDSLVGVELETGGVLTAGIDHRAYHPHDSAALVLWETRPALRTAQFFQALSQASRGRARPPLTEAAAILRDTARSFDWRSPRHGCSRWCSVAWQRLRVADACLPEEVSRGCAWP